MKSVALHNLGCKVNAYELDFMQQMLQEKGYKIVSFDEAADIYIVNTCTVTNIADRKSRQLLHRARKRNPEAIVVAVGCYVQTGAEGLLADGTVDLAIGNNRKKELAQILEEYLARRETAQGEISLEAGQRAKNPPETSGEEGKQEETVREAPVEERQQVEKLSEASGEEGKRAENLPEASGEEGKRAENLPETSVEERQQGENLQEAPIKPRQQAPPALQIDCVDLTQEAPYEEVTLKRTAEHTRAYLKIQDGCNQFCSYCVIPYARGRVRSRKEEDVLREAAGFAAAGYREIVLTGIHISSYGVDRGSQELPALLEALSEIQGIERIRLGSLEPGIVTGDFARRLFALGKVCPHFHLSLQSGSDSVLRRMNRRYDKAAFLEAVALLRERYGNPAITTDVIVGFPGETEEEFRETEEYLRQIGFYEMHIFKYSRRKGTPAAAMPGQLTEAKKAERSDRLLALSEELSRAFRGGWLGETAPVLFEERMTREGKAYWVGHTPHYIKVAREAAAGEDLRGRILSCRLSGFLERDVLLGEAADTG